MKLVDDLKDRAELFLHPATGPESIAFDASGGGPYTGVSDGSVVKWDRRWKQFSLPPRRGQDICDLPYQALAEELCGRPLGLRFDTSTGDLYIADAYFGLMKVGPEGGVAEQLATEAEGQPFFFTNGVDVDQEQGIVYFTDSSTNFRRRDFLMVMLTRDATGRLLSYNTRTKEVKVLLRDLAFPNGVAMEENGEFLLVTETTNRRVLRYWLKGAKKGKAEVFAELYGSPDNIKRTKKGEYWVALGSGSDFHGPTMTGVRCPVAARLAGDGTVVEVVEDCFTPGAVSEVEERNGTLWFGSVERLYIEVFSL